MLYWVCTCKNLVLCTAWNCPSCGEHHLIEGGRVQVHMGSEHTTAGQANVDPTPEEHLFRELPSLNPTQDEMEFRAAAIELGWLR